MKKLTICGAPVLSRRKDKFLIYKKNKLYFCNDLCKEKFEDDPQEFLKSKHTQLDQSIVATLLQP